MNYCLSYLLYLYYLIAVLSISFNKGSYLFWYCFSFLAIDELSCCDKMTFLDTWPGWYFNLHFWSINIANLAFGWHWWVKSMSWNVHNIMSMELSSIFNRLIGPIKQRSYQAERPLVWIGLRIRNAFGMNRNCTFRVCLFSQILICDLWAFGGFSLIQN